MCGWPAAAATPSRWSRTAPLAGHSPRIRSRFRRQPRRERIFAARSPPSRPTRVDSLCDCPYNGPAGWLRGGDRRMVAGAATTVTSVEVAPRRTQTPIERAVRRAWQPLLIGALALALDLFRLGSPSLWMDEAFSVQ